MPAVAAGTEKFSSETGAIASRLNGTNWSSTCSLGWRAGTRATPEKARERQLELADQPVVLALHHPPVPIGDPGLDPIALQDPGPFLRCLQRAPALKAVLFGHVHQHWQGELPRSGAGAPIPLWACPSSLASFAAVQPCPLGRPDWPGGRWLTLQPSGEVASTLLRWSPLESA